MINFDEVYHDRLDSSALSPSVTLFMAIAARWWCACTCVSCPSLATLLDTPFSLCDPRLTFLGLEDASLSYILSTLLTFLSLAST
jgi:hypothetical protein